MAKKAGNKIIAIGIKNLKLSSKVSEIATQYRLNKKYPNPKHQPLCPIGHFQMLLWIITN